MVCRKKQQKNKNIILFDILLDWRVDGDPEHEINGANPRVAEGALTMVYSEVLISKERKIFFSVS